jgi:putative transposase
MRFRFIEDRRVDYPVRVMCDVLDVSRAGYYAWRSRPESARSVENRELLEDSRFIATIAGAMAAPVFMSN